MDRELTTGEKYILAEIILAEVFYLLQLGVLLYLVRRWYLDEKRVRVKLRVPKKSDALLRHDWAIPTSPVFGAWNGEPEGDTNAGGTSGHMEQRVSLLNNSQKRVDSSAFNRRLSGIKLNPLETWFANYNNQVSNENSERHGSFEQCKITPTVRTSDWGVKSGLSVRHRKRDELVPHSVEATENKHNLHGTPSSPDTDSGKST